MTPRAVWISPRLWIHLLILRPLLRLLLGVSVEGRSHLVGLERFIIAANHNSHLDVLLLFSVLPVSMIQRTRPVAAREYFGRLPLAFAAVEYLFRPIWITRGAGAGEGIAPMVEALRAGENIIIFPEGTRGAPGQLGRFRSGIGRLSEAAPEVPVVPVFLSGPERALPRHSTVPLPIWNRVVIGPPRRFDAGCPSIPASLEAMMRELSESETGRRHRRRERPERCFCVAVLGIDGSGKSTVSRNVAEELSKAVRVARISDRLEFYADGGCTTVRSLPAEAVRQALSRYAKTARSLRHYKIPKLAEMLLRDRLLSEVRRWHAPEVAILDGSPLMNLVAWVRLYREDLRDPVVAETLLRLLAGRAGDPPPAPAGLAKLPELGALRKLGLARLQLPDAAVMLDVEPSICMRRILGRGERVQAHESDEKLSRLREGYLMVCEISRSRLGIPVRILDGCQDPGALTGAVLAFIEENRGKEPAHGHPAD